MRKHIRSIVVLMVLLSVLAAGVVATETRLLFYWPVCLLLGISAVLAVLQGGWPLRSAPADAAFASALALGGYLISRCLTSPVTEWAREDLYIVLGCGVVYVMAATALSQRRTRVLVLWVLVALTIGNLAVGFVHFSGWWSFHVVPGFVRPAGDSHRIGGFFSNPNHLAAFLSMMALFLTGVAFFGRGGALVRMMLLFLAIAAAIGVSLTISRGALAGLGAGAFVLLLMSLIILWDTHRQMIGGILLGVGLLGVLVGVILYGVFAQQLAKRTSTRGIGEGDPRALIWSSALQQGAEHPWTGAGARMFYEGCVRLRPTEAPSWMKDARFVHNDWLQMKTDYGWVGLGLLALFVAVHLRQGWVYLRWFVHEKFTRTASTSSSHLGYTVGAVAALVGALVHALFEFHFHVAAVSITAALFAGFLANPGIVDPMNRPWRIPGVRMLTKYALLPVGGLLIWGAWTHGRSDYCVAKAGLAPAEQDAKFVHRLSWLTKAIEIDSENAQAHYLRGRERMNAAAAAKEPLAGMLVKRAAPDLEKAHALLAPDYHVTLLLSDAYDSEGRSDEAEKLIKEAMAQAPSYQAPRLSMAVHLHRLARFVEAEEAYFHAGQATSEMNEDWRKLYFQMLKDASG
jgi:O-antigen ligase